MDKNRLLWASRRGMLELDLVLMPFVEQGYDSLSQADRELYHLLLEQEDQDLFAWFLGRQQPDGEGLRRIVRKVRDFSRQRKLGDDRS